MAFDHETFIKSLPGYPGVYRMLNAQDKVIYVGKARRLKNRIASYFSGQQTEKTKNMVCQIANIEITLTHTENEALILENTLIKSLKPQYNILLKEGRGYPYIYVSSQQEYPGIMIHYGSIKNTEGHFFGPYPNVRAVNESLELLQRIFLLRQCEDHFYSHRSRPCLKFQIKRCSGPCTDMISSEEYQQNVNHAMLFLKGKSQQVIDQLVIQMENAALKLEYEKAAFYRDQIANLRQLQAIQHASGDKGEADVIVSLIRGGSGCIVVLFIRDGQQLGTRTWFPKYQGKQTEEDLLEAFLSQHYLGKMIPKNIIISHPLENTGWIADTLTEQMQSKIQISHHVRGERSQWLKITQLNAEDAINRKLAKRSNQIQRLDQLQQLLNLEKPILRMECFDISHMQGDATVASCVVFDTQGPLKSDYRRFNITGITAGDDYAAMNQVLSRRYKRVKKGEVPLPDVIFIDGGKGQISQAEQVLSQLDIKNVKMVGVTKGENRKPGLETLIIAETREKLILSPDTPVLHLIMHIRDEAHRFAITGHRHKRSKQQTHSILEEISGVGPKLRQRLLQQFGGLKGVSRAGVEDLARIKNINSTLAQKIYDVFHE